jgi:ribose transport system permease protein
MGIVLHWSVFGRYLYAVGKNEEAARYSGIRTDRVIAAAYIICSGIAGLSSVYFVMYTRSISPASHGSFYELYGIAAAVLGGCSLRGGEGSVFGIVLGAVLLQILQNLVNLPGIPSSLNFAVMGGVILIGVLLDQQTGAVPQAPRRARTDAGLGRAGSGITSRQEGYGLRTAHLDLAPPMVIFDHGFRKQT